MIKLTLIIEFNTRQAEKSHYKQLKNQIAVTTIKMMKYTD